MKKLFIAVLLLCVTSTYADMKKPLPIKLLGTWHWHASDIWKDGKIIGGRQHTHEVFATITETKFIMSKSHVHEIKDFWIEYDEEGYELIYLDIPTYKKDPILFFDTDYKRALVRIGLKNDEVMLIHVVK